MLGMTMENNLAKYSLGLEWHPDLSQSIMENLHELDCIEIIAENFFYKNTEFLKVIGASNIPVLVHCVDTSLGSADGLDMKHLDSVKRIVDQVNAVNVSDHIALSRIDDVSLGQPVSLPFTNEALDVICENLHTIQKHIKLPYLVENEANRFLYPNQEMEEWEFINQISRRSGCQILLDITNTYTNSVNFRFDPKVWLSHLDLESVGVIHIAGGEYDSDGFLLDSHSRKVPDAVWDLFNYTLAWSDPTAIILERNSNLPTFPQLLGELQMANHQMQIAKEGARYELY